MAQPVIRKAPQTLKLDIEGMTCAACSGRIERKLNQLDGVQAQVNLATGQADIQLQAEGPAAETVVQTIAALGYEPRTAELELRVEGMTCAACSARVERALNKQAGVLEASVNLATERAQVRYLPAMLTPESLIQTIRDAGYDAALLDEQAPPEDTNREQQRLQALARDVRRAFALALPVLVLAMGSDFFPGFAQWLQAWAPTPRFWAWVQAILATAVLFGPGSRFFRLGWKAWLHAAPDMNSLVMTGTGAAWLYSTLVLLAPAWFPENSRHLYFEAAAVVIAIVLLGKYLEERAKQSTAGALHKLIGLQADTACRLRDGREETVPVSQLHPGDEVRVRAGERMPVDGTVLEGQAWLDVSMLTGEPMPRAVEAGDEVQAGTLVNNGLLRVRVDRLGRDTLLAQIIRMVEQAQAGKLPIQQLADKVIRVFSPIVLVIAVLTFMAWLLWGPEPALNHALVAAVAVLVIACPCAMGLATPAAILVGTGRAAELGVLFRNGEALEHLSRVRTLLMDKTGTLTQGRPQLVEWVAEDRPAMLAIAAALEAGSNHPLAQAVLAAAEQQGITPAAVQQFENHPGRGVSGVVEGRRWWLGNARLMEELGRDRSPLAAEAERLAAAGHTVVWLADEQQARALLAIADPPREEAARVVATMRQRGVRVVMVTGDQPVTARHVAEQLGVDEVHAEVLPGDKAAIVAQYRQQQAGLVAFVGDGINDAPALAEADVGIAMGGGTDIAVESADVVLMRPGLTGLATAIEASDATLKSIRGNLFWAFIYNVVLIPVAAGVFYPFTGWLLNPMLAGAAMGASSLFVLGNSLRLKYQIGENP